MIKSGSHTKEAGTIILPLLAAYRGCCYCFSTNGGNSPINKLLFVITIGLSANIYHIYMESAE